MSACSLRKISSTSNRVMMVVDLPNASVRFQVYINQDTIENVMKEYRDDVLQMFPDHQAYLQEIEEVLRQNWPKRVGRFTIY